MTRDQFEHAVRAAGAVLGVSEVLVIGSQAIHGSLEGELPQEALRSVEVDVVPRGDEDGRLADLLDGAIGEASMFHSTFGYYAQGVGIDTAILPDGWQERLVPYETPGTSGVVAKCLELHDLWVSKAVAGRPKDRDFCRALVERELVRGATLHERINAVDGLADEVREAALALIDRP